MAHNQCCRSCRHYIASESGALFWCRLRKLKVHSDIATVVFCHHWTRQSPSLPKIEDKYCQFEQQLDFEKSLSTREN